MKYNQIVHDLKLRVNDKNILRDEAMSKHTSFKIGGPVDLMVLPESIDEIKHAVHVLKTNDVDFHVIGNGSNLLVCDKGIRGAVVKIADNFSAYDFHGDMVTVQAGMLMSSLSSKIIENSLKGFEFASGIPGTIGGAVFMNAGAYGPEMKDIVKSVRVLNSNHEVIEMTNGDLEFGYRTSAIQKKGYIVLDVTLKLEMGNKNEIKEIVRDLTERRTTKQPLHLPSAGSTFKRPEGNYAGKLIQDSGLRGVRIGDAQVSDKHCGFVVNLGNSNYKEVYSLIQFIKKVVNDKYGVILEPEVRILGDD